MFSRPETREVPDREMTAKKETRPDIVLVSRHLAELIERARISAGEDEQAAAGAREEIKKTIESFPQLIPTFAKAYKKALLEHRIETGKMSIYMVGGRTTDKPIKADSDIDLVFAFDKPPSPNSHSKNRNAELESSEWISLRKELLEKNFTKICTELNIPNHGQYPGRFQILNWGEQTPAEFEAGLDPNEKVVLLYTDDPEC